MPLVRMFWNWSRPGALDESRPGREDEVAGLLEVPDQEQRLDLFAVLELGQEVDDRLPLRVRGCPPGSRRP